MMMKVYSAVGQFGGVIQMMEVFSTFEAAQKYFHDFIERYGSIEDCDPDQYCDGTMEDSEEFFYWNNGPDADAEITIWPVDMEV